MAHFTRSVPAPTVKGHYRAFRPYVRQDFRQCCAYCLMHEDDANGMENFQLDHYRCRKYHPDLINNFYNLYYACYVCNLYKLHFPTPAQMAQGKQIVDFCHDDFSDHFEQLSDGKLRAKTPAAEYTIIQLRLNRCHLVMKRKKLTLGNSNPTLTPARHMNGRIVDKIMTCEILA